MLSGEDLTTYELTRWNVVKYKAILQGISEALYEDANQIVAENCMTSDTVDAIYNVVQGFKHGNTAIDKALKVTTASYILMVNLNQNCKTQKVFYDVMSYCFRSKQCDSFEYYIYNIVENLTEISANSI